MPDSVLITPADPGPAHVDPVLSVNLIDGIGLYVNGIAVRLPNQKARAMLACLALSDANQESRERLAGLLWSESEERKARATLRQAIHETREALVAHGCHAFTASRLAIGLVPNRFQVDILHTLRAVAGRDAPDALLRHERLDEILMAGFESLDPAFHVWLLARRQALKDRLLLGLEDAYRDEVLPRWRRRRLAEAALRLDPTHEDACRVFMRCAAEDGEVAAALDAYNRIKQILSDDHDMPPSADTENVYVRVKLGEFEPRTPDAPTDQAPLPPADEREPATANDPGTDIGSFVNRREVSQLMVPQRYGAKTPAPPRLAPPKPAVSIEAFAMNGVAADQAHLVEGFRLDLIACLVRFREWYVSGSDADVPSDHTGAPVSARFAVTTTAYQAGGTINVVMVLQDRGSGIAIWSERFELRLTNWFEAQRRIVRRIAATLNVQMSTERLTRQAHVPDVSLEVYDTWLRGQSLIRYFSPDNWNRAATMLAEGIERAPGFSPLYSSLVQMNNGMHFVYPGMFRDPEKQARTLVLAQQAVQLDPRDSRAELCLGWSLAMNQRYAQAELHMDLACELNPNDSWTLIAAAMFHAFCGHAERARELGAQAMEMTLFPGLTHWVYQGSICYLIGDDEGTIAALDRSQDVLTTLPAWRAAALANLGRTAEAREDVRRFYAMVRDNWFGEEAPTEETIGRWLLHLYPISRPETWGRLRAGLLAAGLPVAGCRHDTW
jgi:DNA-binding SARP family transcriptional activator/TolB-like protein